MSGHAIRWLIGSTILVFGNITMAEEVVDVGGMSIIGNRELPKSLYIVPWKDSDVGMETDLSRDLLNEGLKPVDQEEFSRQLDYFELSQKKDGS